MSLTIAAVPSVTSAVSLFRAQQEEEVHTMQELRAAVMEKEQLLEEKDSQLRLLKEEKDKVMEHQQEVRWESRRRWQGHFLHQHLHRPAVCRCSTAHLPACRGQQSAEGGAGGAAGVK